MIITIVFNLQIRIIEGEFGYVSSCAVLDVWSQSNSKKEAEKNIREAISLFIISCFERGTLDQVLKECGFSPSYSAKPVKGPKPNDTQAVKVEIPFNISIPHEPESCPA